ncbi:MAG: hypothetical protein U0744_01115 [Gemmataceae bacterium]
MPDLFSAARPTPPQSQALRYSYEKAGLTIDDQPIPWCAESVIVEALVRVGAITPRTRLEFSLKLTSAVPIPPEVVRPDETPGLARLFFRLPPPQASTTAELQWKQGKRSLGQTTLPVVTRDEFVSRLQIQHATVQTLLSGATAACRTLVSSQARGLIASSVWSSPTSLVPLVDLHPAIELANALGGTVERAELMLSGAQLRSKQALASVELKKPPRTGPWQVRWLLGDRTIQLQTIRAVTRVALEKSLRLLGGRFLVQGDAGLHVVRLPPDELQTNERLGPIFILASSELGMAGRCAVTLRGLDAQQSLVFDLPPQEVLIRDGPTPVALGTFSRDDVKSIRSFELLVGKRRIGILSLDPAPTAHFDAEGSFALPTEDFAWSATAESQLQERLANLTREG